MQRLCGFISCPKVQEIPNDLFLVQLSCGQFYSNTGRRNFGVFRGYVFERGKSRMINKSRLLPQNC